MNPNEAQVTHFDPQAELDALAAELAAKARAAYNDSVFVSDVVVETYLTEAERRHIAAANPANVLALLAERETLLARADRYRSRALALVRLGRRKYAAERAWERTTEEHTDMLWRLMDDAGIPRQVGGEPRHFHSVSGRLELTAETLRQAEAERDRLAAENAALTTARDELGHEVLRLRALLAHAVEAIANHNGGDALADEIWRAAQPAALAAGPCGEGA